MQTEGLSRVIDGDTINIGNYKMRLQGIDAPELKQQCTYLQANWDCGVAAKNNLISKINDRLVSCESKTKDMYNRYIATCYINGENLNAWMVLNGFAVAYTDYSKQYANAETQARMEGKGIWSSEFQTH